MAKGNKHIPLYGLEKIPDKAYIEALQKENSELKLELGKERSYILELEDNLNKLENLSSQELLEKKIKKQLHKYQVEINKLTREKDKLQKEYKKVNNLLIEYKNGKR